MPRIGVSPLVSGLVALLLAAPCAAQRPSTVKALQERGLAALEKGDVAAYIGLLFTIKDVQTHCGEARKITPERLKKFHEKVAKNVEECAKLFDWKTAKLVSVEGGEDKKPDRKCKGAMALEDIVATYSAGGKTYRVKLDDPIRFGSKVFVFTDDPRCRLSEPEKPKKIEPAPPKTP